MITHQTNIDFFFPENLDNYTDLLNRGIEYCPESIRKKILICSTEIIQNNIIHNENINNNSYFSINFQRINQKFLSTYTHLLSKKSAITILEKIDFINSKTIEELQTIYQLNLINPSLNNSVGNGLITCKLKSKNNIIHTEISEIEEQNINNIFFNIVLMFKL